MIRKRLVVADDHVGIRQMLVLLLQSDQRYLVVGEARTGIEALNLCRDHHPDVLLLDLILPDLCGVEVLRRVREFSRCRILIFSGSIDQTLIMRALHCRPHGFVDKSDSVSTLREALSAVASGSRYFTPTATAMLYESNATEQDSDSLSNREIEVLQMIAEGRSSKEIGSQLTIATKTVENHRASVMQKLALHNVAGLTRYAIRRGLVPA